MLRFVFSFVSEKIMNTESTNLPEETLSAFVSFRVRPSALRSLGLLVQSSCLSRSELIRRTLATGGVVYVGRDLISALASCRRETAQIGNLLKMLAGELQVFAENPLLAKDTRDAALSLRARLEGEIAAVKKTRRQLVRVMESVHDRLEELGNGDL